MANAIDGNGIQIQSLSEIINDLINGNSTVNGFAQIYGQDINVDSNTPDGQMINIFALSKQDILDLCVSIYDSFDPDQAVGVALDSLSQLCGIARKGGTYTVVPVVVTTDRSLNLGGLDTLNPFTVSDSFGNLFNLVTSASLSSGTNSLVFQSANMGYIEVLPNTLTTLVSIIAGVVSANNPTVPTLNGADQETDAVLRLRRQGSVSLPSQGFFQSLYAGLLTVDGLTQAVIYENDTNSVDANGVPAHSIWTIVNGGSDADVANMIYTYRSAGCGMTGNSSYIVTQVDGSHFTVYFQRAVYQPLFCQFHLTSRTGEPIDKTDLKTDLAAQYILGIYQEADITSLTVLISAINPDLIVSNAGVGISTASYSTECYPTQKYNIFNLPVANISIT